MQTLAVGSFENFPGGFMFGIDYQFDIEGPSICGRWIHAKNLLKRHGQHTPLPHVFAEGGFRPARPSVGKGKGKKSWEDLRVHSVMGLVLMHEGEYRRWHPNWGPSTDEDEDWQVILEPAPGPDHPFFWHHQLQLTPMTSSAPVDLQVAREMAMSSVGSTIVRRAAGQPLAASFEARNVFIVSLPEVLLMHMWIETAADVYAEWQQCEIIIGRRPRRGIP